MSLIIEDVKNCIWVNKEKTAFDCNVKFLNFQSSVPFTCSEQDNLNHSKEIWERANNGEYGVILDFVEPVEPDVKEAVSTPSSGDIPKSIL